MTNLLFRKVVLAYTAIFLVMLLSILIYNNGNFTYSQDDPYIHLKVGKLIAEGGYGINTGEYSSPSSSILYPFILGMFSNFPGYVYFPILLSFLAGILTILYFIRILESLQYFRESSHNVKIIFLSGLIFASNLIGLSFTGMEHSLQILCTVIGVYILREVSTRENYQLCFYEYSAIITAPLIRYENLAFSILLILFIWYKRKLYSAAISAILLVSLIVGFSVFLISLNLEALPSSVLLKVGYDADSAGLPFIVQNFFNGFHSTFGQYLHPYMILLFLVLAAFIIFAKSEFNHAGILVLLTIIAHFCFGKYGGYGRYEVYVLIIALLIILTLLDTSELINKNIKRHLALAAVYIAALPYIAVMFSTPLAAHNIYQQQYQMSRFIKEYVRVPYAVNDIGIVSFENSEYCLDLFGLANYKMGKYRLSGNIQQMQAEADKKNVKIVMIYPNWFKQIPGQWKYIGSLELTGKVVFLNRQVNFYAVNKSSYEYLRENALSFSSSLPSGVRMVIP